MKPLIKFNLVFLPLLAVMLCVIVFAARSLLQANAREQIAQNARIIMETATSSRIYTTKHVAPLLQHKNFKIQTAVAEFQKTIADLPKDIDPTTPKDLRLASSKRAYALGQQRFLTAQQQLVDSVKGKEGELLDNEFHPQSVPAFAATEIFNYLREKYPEYFYKEATLNPTNERDRATDWETDIVNQFRGNTKLPEFLTTRATPTGEALVLARPIKINNVSCLTCHTTPEQAPPEMVKLYPRRGGYGWKLDEIIGAQIVSVPMAVPMAMADKACGSLTSWIIGSFFGIGLAANASAGWLLRRRN
jgi:hypothetical protein